jgi:3-oxoacyl-[acyl-carrier-protein] synthase II
MHPGPADAAPVDAPPSACVITGTGLVTSAGSSLLAGRSGLAPLRAFDRDRYRTGLAYEIDDRAGGADVPGRASAWLVAAVREALAGREPDPGERVAVLVGTGLRELRSVELWWAAGAPVDGLGELDPGAALARATGLPGAVTLTNACSASLTALALAADLLEQDEADTVVVAGVDAITETMFGLLDRVTPEPPDALRPFDADRRGVLMGEGAAAVVLERAGGPRPALARLRGVGTGCDASHVTVPDAGGIAATMRDAHRRAGVAPGDVDLLFVHGTGTLAGDDVEAAAVAEVFAGAAPVVTALKSMTGHTSGASGLVALVTAVECLRGGAVPPTLGLRTPIPAAADLDLVTGSPRSGPWGTAQVNAFGFGGVNAVAVLEAAA